MVSCILTLALGLCFGIGLQSAPFEGQAISRVRQLNVNDLDSALGERPFAAWIRQLVGPRAGITWQLTECGEQATAPGSRDDLLACVEMSAMLPDDRKVVVLTQVGTFGSGIKGEPKFQFGVIESKGEIFEVPHLRDLPQMLRQPLLRSPGARSDPSVPGKPRAAALRAIVFPATGLDYKLPAADKPLPSRAELELPSVLVYSVLPAPTIVQPVRVSETMLLGSVIIRVLPEYSKFANQNRISGEVKVDVTIDAQGRVTAAQGISGPYLLRQPVEEAVRKWLFKPTLINQEPVSVRGTLTFNFAKQ